MFGHISNRIMIVLIVLCIATPLHAQTVQQQKIIGGRIIRYCQDRAALTLANQQLPLLAQQMSVASAFPLMANKVAIYARSIAAINRAILRLQEIDKSTVFDTNHDGAVDDIDSSAVIECIYNLNNASEILPRCKAVDYNLDGQLTMQDLSLFAAAAFCYRSNFPVKP